PEPPGSPSWQHRITIAGLARGRERPSRTLLAPAVEVLSRLGGNVAFDLSHLRPYGADTELTDLGAALVSYAALTTWLFDDPRLYKSGRLRNLGRQLARELGIRRLRQELNRFAYDADDVVVFLSLSEIELGSVEFLQKLA